LKLLRTLIYSVHIQEKNGITETGQGKPQNLALLTHLIIYSIQQSPFGEANQFSTSQEIPNNLWNQKVHYRIYKCLSLVPILSRLDPVTHFTEKGLKFIYLNIVPIKYTI